MEERASGIILRVRPLTETSLIIHWLTRDIGRVATVAKGARRPKSPFLGKLDLYYQAEFSFARSRRSDLHNLREVLLRETHPRLRENLQVLQQAAYFGVLVELATETEAPIPEVHALVAEALRELPALAGDSKAALAFELKLLTLLGFEPDLESSRLSPGARAAARMLIQLHWPELRNIQLSHPQRRELVSWLAAAIAQAWERLPPQRSKAL